jgi:hypothetical protein
VSESRHQYNQHRRQLARERTETMIKRTVAVISVVAASAAMTLGPLADQAGASSDAQSTGATSAAICISIPLGSLPPLTLCVPIISLT